MCIFFFLSFFFSCCCLVAAWSLAALVDCIEDRKRTGARSARSERASYMYTDGRLDGRRYITRQVGRSVGRCRPSPLRYESGEVEVPISLPGSGSTALVPTDARAATDELVRTEAGTHQRTCLHHLPDPGRADTDGLSRTVSGK